VFPKRRQTKTGAQGCSFFEEKKKGGGRKREMAVKNCARGEGAMSRACHTPMLRSLMENRVHIADRRKKETTRKDEETTKRGVEGSAI